jgi:hypothetical protein
MSTLITLTILVFFVWILSYRKKSSIKKRKSSVKQRNISTDRVHLETHQRLNRRFGSSVKERTIFTDEVNLKTRQRVTTLTKNTKLIERLLNGARRSNSGRSEQWYWEKILYNMERDCR